MCFSIPPPETLSGKWANLILRLCDSIARPRACWTTAPITRKKLSWMQKKRPQADFSAAGWAGCMALPRVLSVASDGSLEMRVASQAQSLRAKHFMLPQVLSERRKALDGFNLEDLCAELIWKTTSSP